MVRPSGTYVRPRLALLFVEPGADKTPVIAQMTQRELDVVVVEARQGEALSDVVARFRETLSDLEQTSLVARTLAVIGGPTVDESVVAARTSVARAMTSYLVREGQGELMLVSAKGLRGPAQHAMAAIADAMSTELRGTQVVVTIVPPHGKTAGLPQVA